MTRPGHGTGLLTISEKRNRKRRAQAATVYTLAPWGVWLPS